ncbi:MAG TPA: DNA gyrase subunit A, partial [Saprospiraceae bacterium]|nr:DNA gyrase subunit A [Saprospiraceae bacterium]
GVSPEVTIDALYAFTDCEVSISPNACVIVDNKPQFLSVEDILQISAERTRDLLKQELQIRRHELDEKWHFASLEKIFIEKRIYHDIEESESWEETLEIIEAGLHKYVSTPKTTKKNDKRLALHRELTQEDIVKLTEIRIKRISKYNTFKADELIAGIEEELAQVHYDLKHLTAYAIKYFENLLEKYGKGRERRTELASTQFDTIEAVHVIANNARLYVNREEGFIGSGLRKDEFIQECSDIDDIIAIRRDGKAVVSRISDKVFMGKNIIHVAVWKKGDERTTYNMMYVDGKSGRAFAKRFNITAVTRDKEYDLTTGAEGSRVVHLSANPNGESEIVEVHLSSGSKARIKVFDFDFGSLEIKGRGSKGNTVTKYPVRKVVLKEVGKSTLGAQKQWMDTASGRLNQEGRGKYLGAFDTGDYILALFRDGSYSLSDIAPTTKFDTEELMWIGRLTNNTVVVAVYFDGEKEWTMVKRFGIETSTTGQRNKFITEHKGSKLYYATAEPQTELRYAVKTGNKKTEHTLLPEEFIDVKGWKALGNKLSEYKIISIEEINKEEKGTEVSIEEETPITPIASVKPAKGQASLFPEPAISKKEKKQKPSKKTPAKKPIAKKAPPKKAPAKKAVAKKSVPKKKTGKKGSNNGRLKTGDTIEFDL